MRKIEKCKLPLGRGAGLVAGSLRSHDERAGAAWQPGSLDEEERDGERRRAVKSEQADGGVDGVAPGQYKPSVDAHDAMGICLAMRPGLFVCDAMRAHTNRCKCADVRWARMGSVDQQELDRRL